MNYDNKHKVICAAGGRHWKSPGSRGQWTTKARRRGPSQRYYGPSKKTLGKRIAKRVRGKGG